MNSSGQYFDEELLTIAIVQTTRKWLVQMKKDKRFKDRNAKCRRRIFKRMKERSEWNLLIKEWK